MKTKTLLILSLGSLPIFAAMNSGTPEASAYRGTSFQKIVSILLDRNVPAGAPADELAVYRSHQLPHYPVSASAFIQGGKNLLEAAAKRTVTRKEDYYPRLQKWVHANGICYTGKWEIHEKNPYSGFFQNGSEGLIVARLSAAMSNTSRGSRRSIGFAGKIFSTLDPQEVVKTANFFTLNAGLGENIDQVAEARFTNEPPANIGFTSSLFLGLKIADALGKADISAGFRPLDPVSNLALPASRVPVTPKWIRLSVDQSQWRPNPAADFREEMALDHGKNLVLNIDVSNTTKNRKSDSGWEKIGKITLNQSYISYGCDRMLHFAHPKVGPQ